MGFPTSVNQGRAPPLTFPKSGLGTQIWCFSHKFRQKALKICYKVSMSKNFQRQSCSAINYLSNSINILAGDDPVPVKFETKGADPNRNDARFTFHTRRAVQSAIADLVFINFNGYLCKGDYVLSSVQCPSVCLSVSSITRKGFKRFSRNLVEVWKLSCEEPVTFWGWPHSKWSSDTHFGFLL